MIDDGSSDETVKLLERIAEREGDPRFSWDRHDNMGQARTLNEAFARLDGDLIGYVSSDDLLLPGAISRIVEEAENHPEAEVIYPWFRIDELGGHPIDVVEALEFTYADALRLSLCIAGVAALVRRSFLERVGGWDPRVPMCPDVEWWLRDPNATYLRIPEVLAVNQTHPGSISAGMGRRAMLEQRLQVRDAGVFSRDDLPDELMALKDEAYGATLIDSGSQFYYQAQRDNPRYMVDDRFGPDFSRKFGPVAEETRATSSRSLNVHKAHLEAATETLENLKQTTTVLEDAAGRREHRILELEAEIAELRTQAPVPVPEVTHRDQGPLETGRPPVRATTAPAPRNPDLPQAERNPMTRVLILGGSGMLGHKLVQRLGGRFDLWTTVRR